MQELRKDYILDKWVIISKVRGKRPVQFEEQKCNVDPKDCVFCPGNEEKTPIETYRLEENRKWAIRCFPNKFSAVSDKKSSGKKSGFFEMKPAFGYHEVMVDSRDHKKQLHDMDAEHIYKVIDAITDRIEYYRKKEGIEYVQVFKNHLKDAGTSLVHSHCQIVAMNHVGTNLTEKISAVESYRKKHKSCPYCDIIKKEKKEKKRYVFENDSFAAICPFAPQYAHEITIYSKRCIKAIWELTEKEKKDLASMIKKIIYKLGNNNVPYNMEINNGIQKKPFHFNVSITPREFKLAGFEISTGIIINPVSPEDAKRWYRSK